MNKNRRKQIIMIILSAIVTLGGSGFLCIYLFASQNSEEILTVAEKNSLTYRVYQRNNPYSESEYLEQGRNYLRTYTDYIKVSNNYQADLSEEKNITYRYRAVATLIARYNKTAGGTDNPAVMDRQFDLDEQNDVQQAEEISIDKEYDIYLDEYRKQAEEFAASVALPIASEVRLDFTIELTNGSFESSFTRSMVIPISSEFYNIELEGNEEEIRRYNLPPHNITLWMQLGIAAITLAGAWVLLTSVKKLMNKQSDFYQKISGYLHVYDDMIINAESDVDITEYKKIQINSFKEMTQLSNKLNLPIIFVEKKHKASFYVIKENIIYIYEMYDE